MTISAKQLQKVLYDLFIKYGFGPEKSALMATIHIDSTLAGISSHGINRVPLFIEYVEKGIVKVNAKLEKVAGMGSMERWEGNFGPGSINATKCTQRAIELAKENGMGLVALRNTNHWMRGGTYGQQAADAGCMSIMFTNTQPNMPPWGGKYSRIGNNPFVVSIPRSKGHVILDMALSQFAFGKINEYRLRGEKMPFAAGWDDEDTLSDDPEKILMKERGLPIGYWKGSALSMVLDMLSTLLSAGNSTSEISKGAYETGISQVFFCIDPKVFRDGELQEKLLDEIIAFTKDVAPMHPGNQIYYPGERSFQKRVKNSKEGVHIDDGIWKKILSLCET